MKGGFGCSPCCGPQNPCPSCTHFTADDYFTGATASFTLDGVAVPSVTNITGLVITPPAIVRTACFAINDTFKRATFSYEYLPEEFLRNVFDANGCDAYAVYAKLYCKLCCSGGECTYTFSLEASRVTGECSDTGGAGVLSSWQVVGNNCAGGVPEDCAIETLDWLATLSVSASFSYAACECPP
jgi:hypothetical protein